MISTDAVDAVRGHTPAYIYDLAAIQRGASQVAEALHGTEIYYALKANPLPIIAQAMTRAGLGIEVASSGELDIALTSGAPPSHVIFGGPAKSRRDIELALTLGVKALHCESVEEIQYATKARQSLRSPTLLIARINPDWSISATIENMTGRSSQFGIDAQLLSRFISDNPQAVDGVHMYQASQVRNWREVADSILRLDSFIHSQSRSWNPTYVNYGGGFGISLEDTQEPFDLDAFATWWHHRTQPPWRRSLELGRYLVGPYGYLVVEVRHVKLSRGQTFIITDGGMNAFLRPIITGERHRIRLSGPVTEQPQMDAHVTGPLCTPLDVIGFYRGPSVAPGDLLLIDDAGAYGPTLSPVHFLGHPTPSEWITEGGLPRVVRTSQSALSYSQFGLNT